jgi:hypothetical protein
MGIHRKTTPKRHRGRRVVHRLIHVLATPVQIWATWTTRAAYAGAWTLIVAIVLKSGATNLTNIP